MASFAKEDISVTELRAISYEYASRFGQVVAKCAEEILLTTEDTDERRRALLWRMYAPPQARAAAFNEDPLAGLLELWTLAGQQKQYFLRGDGAAFGEGYPCVDGTAIQLDEEARDLAFAVLGPKVGARMRERVDDWVAANPIEGEFYVRPTAQANLAAFVGDVPGGLASVGGMEETLRDLNNRIAILSVQLPTEARYQAEFLIDALFEEHIAGPSESVVRAMKGIAAFLRDFEDTLEHQTTRLLQGFAEEREAAFGSIDEGVEAPWGGHQERAVGGVRLDRRRSRLG